MDQNDKDDQSDTTGVHNETDIASSPSRRSQNETETSKRTAITYVAQWMDTDSNVATGVHEIWKAFLPSNVTSKNNEVLLDESSIFKFELQTFENDYKRGDSIVFLSDRSDVNQFMCSNVKVDLFGGDSRRDNPINQASLDELIGSMTKQGICSACVTVILSASAEVINSFRAAPPDNPKGLTPAELSSRFPGWSATLVDGHHVCEALVSVANDQNNEFPGATVRVVWLLDSAPIWQYRRYSETVNSIARTQAAYEGRSNSSAWKKLRVVDACALQLIDSFAERSWEKKPKTRSLPMKFNGAKERFSDQPMWLFYTYFSCIRLPQSEGLSLEVDAFADAKSYEYLAPFLKLLKNSKAKKTDVYNFFANVRPAMFPDPIEAKAAEQSQVFDYLMLTFLFKFAGIEWGKELDRVYPKLCKSERLAKTFRQCLYRVHHTSEQWYGIIPEYSPVIRSNRGDETRIQTPFERSLYVRRSPISVDDIYMTPTEIQGICSKELLSFLQLLGEYPSVTEAQIGDLLKLRRCLLWIQSVFNIVRTAGQNLAGLIEETAEQTKDPVLQKMSRLGDSNYFKSHILVIASVFVDILSETVTAMRKERSSVSKACRDASFKFDGYSVFCDTENRARMMDAFESLSRCIGILEKSYDFASEQINPSPEIRDLWEECFLRWKIYGKELRNLYAMINFPDVEIGSEGFEENIIPLPNSPESIRSFVADEVKQASCTPEQPPPIGAARMVKSKRPRVESDETFNGFVPEETSRAEWQETVFQILNSELSVKEKPDRETIEKLSSKIVSVLITKLLQSLTEPSRNEDEGDSRNGQAESTEFDGVTS